MKTPEALKLDLAHAARSKKWFGWAAFACGLIMVVSPLNGLAKMAAGLITAFSTLQKNGGADPTELAEDISVALLTMFYSLIPSVLALIPFIVFLVIFLKYRKILRQASRRE